MSRLDLMLAQEYGAAMRDSFEGRRESALKRAYDTGRRALAEGMGILELVAAYEAAAVNAVKDREGDRELATLLDEAFGCFAESLSPFEMVFRGVGESTALLRQSLNSLQHVGEQLQHQNEELTAAHRAVERERTRYQTLFDFAPEGYVVTGIEGAIREANTAASALLHTPKDLLPGQSLIEFVVESDRAAFREGLLKLQTGAVSRLEDWQIALRPRKCPPIPVALTVVADRTTPAIASLCWLIRDVTERRRIEKEQTRSLMGRARAQAERRFEFLAEASSLLVGSLDVEANLVSVVRLTASYLGGWCFISVVDRDGSLRQVEVAQADPSLTDLATDLRRHSLLHRQTQLETASLSDPQVTKGIDNAWCDRVADSADHAELLRQLRGSAAIVLPLRIHDRLMGLITLIAPPASRHVDRDLGEDLARLCALALENARLYRDVVAERDKVERASRAKDEFVAILAHELRNPLTPLVGWIQILQNHPPAMQDVLVREGMEAMERNARKLKRLVNDCLDLAGITEGKMRLERNPVDLKQIVSASLDSIREIAAARGLKLSVDLGKSPVPVLGDAMRLEQVITNLLINAVNYSDRNGVVTVGMNLMPPDVEVVVKDTGAGIDPAFLDQIFQPFRQGTSSWLTSQSGLGLGLTIARQIAEMHDGRVWAESDGVGKGSTFRLRLPVSTWKEEASTVGAEAPHPPATAKGIRILLVEDAEDILFLMKTELEMLGFVVSTAGDGRAGLEAARNNPPDLIISDIKMPMVDGYELIRSVRATPELSRIPAIALTGFEARATTDRARAAGFDACLTKPAERKDMLAVIERLSAEGRIVRGGSPNPEIPNSAEKRHGGDPRQSTQEAKDDES